MPPVLGVTPALDIALTAGRYEASPTWTDLIADGAGRQVLSVEWHIGKPSGTDHDDVGWLRAVVRNDDDAFNPRNASSPYYPNLVRYRQVRFRGTVSAGFTVFAGWLDYIELSDPDDDVPTATLHCIDALGLLERDKAPDLGFRRRVLSWSPAPSAYWRLGDRDTASTAFDETANRNLATYGLRDRDEVEGLLVGDADKGHDLAGTGVVVGASRVGWSGTSHGLVMLFRPHTLASTQTLYYQWRADGSNDLRVELLTTGAVRVVAPSGSIIMTSGALAQVGVRAFLGIRRSGSNWWMTLQTGGFVSDVTGSHSTSFTATWPIFGGRRLGAAFEPLFNGEVDELVMWPSVDPGDLLMLRLTANAPGASDLGADRVVHFMDRIAWPASWRTIEAGDEGPGDLMFAMAEAPASSLAAVHKTEQTFRSRLFARASNRHLVYRPFRYEGSFSGSFFPAVTFDDGDGSLNVPIGELSVVSPEHVADRVIASNDRWSVIVGNTPAGQAPEDKTLDIWSGIYDSHAHAAAERALRAVRSQLPAIDTMAIEFVGLSAAQKESVLGIGLGDGIAAVRNLPGAPARTVEGYVRSVSGTVTPGTWRMTFATDRLLEPYVETARATRGRHLAVSSGADTVPALPGDRWDTAVITLGRLWVDGLGWLPLGADLELKGSTNVYLVQASAWWEGNATGGRELQVRRNDSSGVVPEAVITERGSTQGIAQQVGTLTRAGVTVARREMVVKQTSGGSLQLFAAGLGDANWAWAPEFMAARIRPSRHVVRANRTTNLSLTSAAETTVDLNAERFDSHGMHDNSTNNSRLTAQKAATFFVGANAWFAASANHGRDLIIRRDGSTKIGQSSTLATSGSERTGVHVTSLWRATAAGQYVELRALQNHGAAVNLEAQPDFSPEFWAVEVDGPSCRVTRSTTQGIPHTADASTAVGEPVSFSSARWDDASMWSAGQPTRLVVPASVRPGTLAVVWGGVLWSLSAAGVGTRRLSIRWNGSVEIGRVYNGALTFGVHGQTVWSLWQVDPGDYFELLAAQSSGGSLNLDKTDEASPEFGLAFITAD